MAEINRTEMELTRGSIVFVRNEKGSGQMQTGI